MDGFSHHIAILCQYAFPEGMAATTRIVSYGKGLQRNGVKTDVFSFQWLDDKSDVLSEGEVSGVHYKISHRWHTGKGKLYKMLVDFPAVYFKAVRDIMRSHRDFPIEYVFVSFDSLPRLFFFVPLLKILGFKLVYISDEFPEPIRRLKSDIPRWQYLCYRFISLFFCKRVLMTRALEMFYNKTGVLPTHIMCSILDESRFEEIQRFPVEREYLCYMGNMQLAKDNVDNIVRAFSRIADEFPNLDLRLYGTPSEDDARIINLTIEETCMTGRAKIMGRVNYENVPVVLANARVLVTSQPATRRAEGGFPTKMAEYMMCKVPMIVTDVGEISQYVQDGKTTYMVPPCNPAAYAEKLRWILLNKDEAAVVADGAYKFAVENFSSVRVAEKLKEFLFGQG